MKTAKYKKGQKVNYLGLSAEIVNVKTDGGGRIYYDIHYTSEQGNPRAARGIYESFNEITL